jgi:hypothetical protein
VEGGQGSGGDASDGLAAPERPQPPPPPGEPARHQAAPAPPATSGEPARPLRQLGNAVTGLLCLIILVDLVALWADTVQLGLVTDVRDGERVSLEDLTASDDRVATIGLLQGGSYIACGIAFLIWYGRAFRNLERLGARDLHWGRRAVIVYWFVPIVNLFLPKQVINDIWRASDPDLPAVNREWERNRVPVLFHVWWVLWLVSGVVINIAFGSPLDEAETPEEMVALAREYVAIDVVDIIPAILAILVVRAITNRQEERRMRHERGELRPAGAVESEEPAPAAAAQPG